MIDFAILDAAIGRREASVPITSDSSSNGASEYLPDCDKSGNPVDSVPALPPIVDSALFCSEAIEEPAQLIAGLVHQGTKVIMGGGSKSFKTWLQLDAAISVAYGLSWLGFETVQGRVLFVNFEIKSSFFQKRINKICDARQINQIPNCLDIWNLRGHCCSYHIILPQIIERIKSTHYSMVFLDPIYKLYGNTNENNAGEVAQLLNGLERVCVETDAAVAFGAHYSKGNQASKESIDRISGSGVFSRDPDSIIPFTSHSENNCFSVEPILRNLPPVNPFVVRWKFPLMERDDDLDPSNLKKQTTGRDKKYDPLKVLNFISGMTKENPVTFTEWERLSGIPRQTLTEYAANLRLGGLIATIGEGRLARQYITQKGSDELLNWI